MHCLMTHGETVRRSWRISLTIRSQARGIVVSCGFVGPPGADLNSVGEAEVQYYQMLRAAFAAFGKGMPGVVAVEFARRATPPDVRPKFSEMENDFRASAGRSPTKL